MNWHRRIHKRVKLRRSRSRNSSSGSSGGYGTDDEGAPTMDHSHAEDQLWGAVEILPQRLYYAPLKFFPQGGSPPAGDTGSDHDGNDDNEQQTKPKSNKPIHYFTIDHELIYWNFFLDFGPLNLGQLHRFCSKLNAKLSSPEYKDHIICYYSGAKGEARANASFLICAWSMLYLGRTLDESYFGFREEFGWPPGSRGVGEVSMPNSRNVSLPPQHRLRRSSSNVSSSSKSTHSGDEKSSLEESPFARVHPLPPFHDASPIVCTYDLSVFDCLQGLDKARQLGFFKFSNAPDAILKPKSNEAETTWPPRTPTTFNVEEYEHFEQVENGDLNWIVADRILAFAGPQAARAVTPEGFCMLTPADYIPYFERRNVKLIVRLNKKCYNEEDFETVGMKHVEHYYLDGSCPPMSILQAVVADMESIGDTGAMAVHCKAGLGRTGTCIGAYLMKHYRLTAREVIGWMRICRPGMVIGPQQHFMEDIEGIMWQDGETFRGTGLRSMSMGSEDDHEEEGESVPALKTPPPKGTVKAGTSPGHVSIVTPDGQPLHIPTTPVVARKLDMKQGGGEGEAMEVSPPPAAASEGEGLKSTLSSASSLPSMGALNVTATAAAGAEEDAPMREGDQANALLSRRLDQSRARHRHEEGRPRERRGKD